MKRTQLLHLAAPALAVALLVPFAGSVRADVRLQDDGGGPEEPGLAIRLSPAGPWSLVGPLDETVLNPAGDSFADGLPSDAPQDGNLLAAWARPGDGRIHLSRWDETAWSPLVPFENTASIGVPRVDALGDGWAVTWQQLQVEPIIRAGGVGDTGEHHDSEPIIHGWLLDESWMGDTQLILHQNPDRTALILTGVLWSVPGVPSPVDIVFSVELGAINMGDPGDRPSPSITPVVHPGHGRTKALRGAWSRRIAISWWDEEGALHQAVVDRTGDVRYLENPRFEPGPVLSGDRTGKH